MKKPLLPFFFLLLAFGAAAQPNTWTQKANVGTIGRSSGISFSIAGKGYLGMGTDATSNVRNDLWEYDPATNTWAQKANLPAAGRSGATGFSIGSKGYVGAGSTPAGYASDFWEYDPAANTWTQKANFAGGTRMYAVGLGIGTKGYMGTGQNDATVPQNDFWEFDPAANTWTQKANLTGTGRYYASAFTLGQKGYVGLGFAATNPNDLWEYDPAAGTWTQKANFTGAPRAGAATFTVNQKAYIATGHTGVTWVNDVWEYDLTANAWTQVAAFPGGARAGATGFGIGQKGYVGTGYNGSSYALDLWEYSPPAQFTITTFALATTDFCPGDALDVSFITPDAFAPGNLFSAQLSDAAGSFASPVTIGTLSGTGSGTIAAVIPASATAGTQYKIRVVGSNPGTIGPDSGDDVIIHTAPSAAFTGLPATVCQNAAAVALTGTTPGGTFSGPGVSGSSFDPALAGVGTHTISYVVSSGFCSDSTAQQVTVSPLPAASIAGLPAEMCSYEGVVTLTGTPAGGTFSGTGVSGNIFDPAAAGDGLHTITYSVTANGCTSTATQQVQVIHVPPAGVPSFTGPVCTNSGAIIFAGSLWFGTWSGPGMIGNVFDPAVAGPGLHTITHTVTAGNCSTSDSVQVVVVAAPSSAFTYTSSFTQFAFTAAAQPNVSSYSWTFGDGNTSAQQNPVHTYGTAGTFTVSLTATTTDGCSTTTTQQVNSVINGIAEEALNQISLYPNPAGTYVKLESKSQTAGIALELTTLTGQLLLRQEITSGTGQVDVSHLPAGTYAARVSLNGQTHLHKLVISR